jgi:hypothetical protein
LWGKRILVLWQCRQVEKQVLQLCLHLLSETRQAAIKEQEMMGQKNKDYSKTFLELLKAVRR